MAELTTSVHRDLDSDITTVTVDGDLDLTTAATLRGALLKALIDCPVAITADLTCCRVTNTVALSVFPSLARLGISRPSVLIVVAGVHYGEGSPTPAALGATPTFPTTRAAYEAIAAGAIDHRRERHSIRPTRAAPRQAAAAVGRACSQWNLSHLRHQAAAVAAELVNKSCESAKGPLQLDIMLRGDFLHLRVIHQQDLDQLHSTPAGSDATTAALAYFASAWGHVKDADQAGRASWATMRVRPLGS